MKSNTVIISKSCLSSLPPGSYHYSIFESIDIFKPLESIEEIKSDYQDLTEDFNTSEKTIEKLEEQLYFARSVLSEIQSLNSLPKKWQKMIALKIEESLFEQ